LTSHHNTQTRVLTQTKATNPQFQFWNNPARFRLFVGGRGSGKTHAGALESLRMPTGSIGTVIAPTYPMLRDGAMRTILHVAGAGNVIQEFNQSHGELKLIGNRTILFRSADNADRLRGANLGWLWLDEGALMDPETWPIAVATLRETPGRAWITTTPRGRNWIWELWNRGGLDYAMIESRTADNVYLPAGFVEMLRATMTAEQYEQEANGKFIDVTGAMFKRQWFEYVDSPPAGLDWVRYWDLAASIKESADYTAGARVAFDDNGVLYIDDVIRIKAEWPDVQKLIIKTALTEPGTVLGIEEALHGLAGLQELRRRPELLTTTIRGIRVDRDKKARAMPWAARAESGKCMLIRGDWNRVFLDELVSFPMGSHDDMVDAVSGAVGMIGTGSIDWGFM
jgi:predicted phage terminase large subunit-like protein